MRVEVLWYNQDNQPEQLVSVPIYQEARIEWELQKTAVLF